MILPVGNGRGNMKVVDECSEIEHAIEEGNDLFLLSFLQSHKDILKYIINEEIDSMPLKDMYVKPYIKFNIFDLARKVCDEILRRKRLYEFAKRGI